MDHTNIKSIGEIYSDIQEAYTVQGKARIGSTSGKATDASVSSAVDKALENKGTAVSASSEKGKTGVTGSGSFRMSGSIGGSSNKPKPTNTTSRPKPTSSTSRPTGTSDGPVRVQNPAAEPVRVQNPVASGGRGGRGGMVRSDTTSDLDTYNLVLEYLLDEGFASTEQSADKIILNMSEAWFEGIMEATRAAKEGKKDEHRVGVEIRAKQASKSLEAKKERQKVLDKHEKKTGTKLDISKSPEGKSHDKNFPGSRQKKKVKGEKETESETQNRRAGRQVLRVLKHGFTEKEKKESKAREKYDSPRD